MLVQRATMGSKQTKILQGIQIQAIYMNVTLWWTLKKSENVISKQSKSIAWGKCTLNHSSGAY